MELTVDGDVVIATASISDNFREVEHNEVRFPVECAREIADELYRLACATPRQQRTEYDERTDTLAKLTGRNETQQRLDGGEQCPSD
jgi:hypothetical protein